jgi:hypothetical protein
VLAAFGVAVAVPATAASALHAVLTTGRLHSVHDVKWLWGYVDWSRQNTA